MNLHHFSWGLLLGIPFLALQQVEQCGEDDDDDVPVYNLTEDVSVSYDTYGIPHVYGQTLNDVVFGQGYVTARDRLWQMDYLRRQGHGTLSEVFGESNYKHDLTVRALGFTEHAEQALTELEFNAPEVYTLLQSYSAGVNAWIEAAIEGRDGASLSPQIEAAGYVPELWTPVDCLVIDKALAYGSSASTSKELTVWLVSTLIGPAVTDDLLRPKPTDPGYILEGYYDDFAGMAPDAGVSSQVGMGVSQPVDNVNDSLNSELGKGFVPPSGEARARLLQAIEAAKSLNPFQAWAGSNNWVISGELTQSGYPILANDTHEGVNHPPTYYQVHLSTAENGGDSDIEGYGFPGIPLLLLGHNQVASWGLTLNLADVTDLYNETTVGTSVLFNDEMVAMEGRTETIYVRPDGGSVEDAEPRTEIVYNVPHHGPLLPREVIDDIPRDISVRWTGFNGSTLLQVAHTMVTARSFEDLQEGLSTLVAGAVNVVYADIDGNIGYTGRADLPIRSQLDYDNPPYMVLPGTGEYEWTGEILPDHLIPWAKNPEKGYLVTANNDPAGLLDDNDALNGPYIDELGSNIYLGVMYDSGHRAYRIQQLIEAAAPDRNITMEDVAEWQADTTSRLALRLVPYIQDAANRRSDLLTPDMLEALTHLQEFADDGYQCPLDSHGCLIFHAWLSYALGDFFGDETDPALFANLDSTYTNIFTRPLIYFLDATTDIVDALDFQASGGCASDPMNAYCTVRFPSESMLNYFDNQETTDVVETRDEIILGSLEKAVSILVERGGSLTGLNWGDVHMITFNDPAEAFGYTDATLGPYSIDGAFFSVDVADARLSRDGEFVARMDVGTGPSQRTIFEMDPAGIDQMDVLPGGQAERVDSPYFSDQLDLYLTNGYREMPYYIDAVNAAQVHKLTLPAQFPASGNPQWE